MVVVVAVAVVFLVVDGCGRTTRLVAAGSLAAGHVLVACASPQMQGILKRHSGASGGATYRFCISVILLEGLPRRLSLVYVFSIIHVVGKWRPSRAKVREAHRSEKKKGESFSCRKVFITQRCGLVRKFVNVLCISYLRRRCP